MTAKIKNAPLLVQFCMFLYYLFWYLCFLQRRIEMGEVCNNGAPLCKKEKIEGKKKNCITIIMHRNLFNYLFSSRVEVNYYCFSW